MKPQLPNNYKEVLKELKDKIAQSQVKVVVTANKQMLWLYWQIGNEIIKQKKLQGWGAKIIDRLSADLKSEFPKIKGFSVRNLKYMQKFALYYQPNTIQKFTSIWKKIKKEGFVRNILHYCKVMKQRKIQLCRRVLHNLQKMIFCNHLFQV